MQNDSILIITSVWPIKSYLKKNFEIFMHLHFRQRLNLFRCLDEPWFTFAIIFFSLKDIWLGNLENYISDSLFELTPVIVCSTYFCYMQLHCKIRVAISADKFWNKRNGWNLLIFCWIISSMSSTIFLPAGSCCGSTRRVFIRFLAELIASISCSEKICLFFFY